MSRLKRLYVSAASGGAPCHALTQRRLTSSPDTPKSCQSSSAILVKLRCISTAVCPLSLLLAAANSRYARSGDDGERSIRLSVGISVGWRWDRSDQRAGDGDAAGGSFAAINE